MRRIVADYLGADHTEVLFTKQDIFDTLSTLIYNIETYDITTIRASMGMYLVSKYIIGKYGYQSTDDRRDQR